VFTMRNRKQSKIENIGHEMHHNTADRSEVDSEEEEEEEVEQGKDHYLLSDGKTYIFILCIIVLCGAIVVSNIFFPNKDRDKKNKEEDLLTPADNGRAGKHFLHPTMKVRSLMGEDIDDINEQITKVTRLPNAPDRSQPHLGNTGHGQGQAHQQTPGQVRGLGSFSVVVPIYLGAIFVFFVYIVAKILLKKLDGKDQEEVVDVTQAYKDDNWWSKLLERIARVSEAVNSGEDIELVQPDDQHDQEPIDQPDDENEKSSSVQDINILSCRLDRTEQSLDSLVSEMGQLAGLLTQQSLLINQLLTEIKTGKESRAQEV